MSAIADLNQSIADLITAINSITALLANLTPTADVIAANDLLRANVSRLQALVPPPFPGVATS